MSEQEEYIQQELQPKKYIRNFTEEGRLKQKQHLENIRQKAMEKKRELKEITLKAKLMKLEPKIELAKKYDEYIYNKNQYQQQPEEMQVPKPIKEKKKKIIYKEIDDEEEEEEQIVYIKKNKPIHQPYNGETLDRTLYKSSTEQLHMRAVEERIKHNLAGCYGALVPREF